MQENELANFRQEYSRGELDLSNAARDPVSQFKAWMDDAIAAGISEPTAMSLATTSRNGRPSARMVLLKGFDEKGFVFFTNYNSRKAKEIGENPFGALVFYWPELERQVRIEGRIVKIKEAESDDYFATRPAESQVSAIISPQSQVVPDRSFLERLRDAYLANNADQHQRPGSWGGFRLVHDVLEFWQGRPGRLHDRIRYTLKHKGWEIERLAP